MDCEIFEKDLERGLYFEVNIFIGYGLGSFGVFCVVVYDCYVKDFVDCLDFEVIFVLQEILVCMESFFY